MRLRYSNFRPYPKRALETVSVKCLICSAQYNILRSSSLCFECADRRIDELQDEIKRLKRQESRFNRVQATLRKNQVMIDAYDAVAEAVKPFDKEFPFELDPLSSAPLFGGAIVTEADLARLRMALSNLSEILE